MATLTLPYSLTVENKDPVSGCKVELTAFDEEGIASVDDRVVRLGTSGPVWVSLHD